MNIEKLIEAAKKIEQLHIKQIERSKLFQQLARDSRSGNFTRQEIESRKQKLDMSLVVNFSDPIEDLIKALHAKK